MYGINITAWYADEGVEVSFRQAVVRAIDNIISLPNVRIIECEDEVWSTSSTSPHLRGRKLLTESSVEVIYAIGQSVVGYTFDDISQLLEESVDSGYFTSALQSLALTNSVPSLATAYSSAGSLEIITTQAPTTSPTSHPDSHSSPVLNGGDIAAIVITSLFGFSLIAFMMWRWATSERDAYQEYEIPHAL